MDDVIVNVGFVVVGVLLTCLGFFGCNHYYWHTRREGTVDLVSNMPLMMAKIEVPL